MRLESPLMMLAMIPIAAVFVWGLIKLRREPPALRIPTFNHLVKIPFISHLWWLPPAIQGIASAVAVFSLARPQINEVNELIGEGSDFVIALDMSGSMNAVDLPPERIMEYHRQGQEPPNRFETARETLKRFIKSRYQDRIGLVIFSSRAFVKFPLTLDKDAMLRILDGLVLDDGVRGAGEGCLNGCTITGEATAIGDALGRAYKRLEGSDTKSRSIILITDGDNNAGKVAPEEVAKYIAEQTPERPVRVYTFLVGGGTDTYVPARDPFTGRPLLTPAGFRVYEKPKEPFPVNPSLLQEIAKVTGGAYFEAATEEDFRREFEQLEKTRFTTPALEHWQEAYLPPLVVAITLFIFGELLRVTWLRRWP